MLWIERQLLQDNHVSGKELLVPTRRNRLWYPTLASHPNKLRLPGIPVFARMGHPRSLES